MLGDSVLIFRGSLGKSIFLIHHKKSSAEFCAFVKGERSKKALEFFTINTKLPMLSSKALQQLKYVPSSGA